MIRIGDLDLGFGIRDWNWGLRLGNGIGDLIGDWDWALGIGIWDGHWGLEFGMGIGDWD